MTSKKLAIAAAILFLSGASAGQVLAQPAAQPAGQSAAPATDQSTPAPGGATTAPTPDQGTPAGTAAPAPAAAAPPPPPSAGSGVTTPKENPYGLRQLWEGQNGHADWVARGVMILLALMSIGTWYIFFMKYWEQQRVLGQAATGREAFLGLR